MDFSYLQKAVEMVSVGVPSAPWEALKIDGGWQIVKAVNRTPVILSEVTVRFLEAMRNVVYDLDDTMDGVYCDEDLDNAHEETEEALQEIGRLKDQVYDLKQERDDLLGDVYDLKQECDDLLGDVEKLKEELEPVRQ